MRRRRAQHSPPACEFATVDAAPAAAATARIEAWVYSAREGRKIRRTFAGNGRKAAAKAWRADATVAIGRGTLRAPSNVTLREAADAWLAGARDGSIRTRSGDPYKPSAFRGYEQALRTRILPDLGAANLSAIERADVQDLADRLLAEGLDPSTIRNAVMPLRAIYRRAVARGEVSECEPDERQGADDEEEADSDDQQVPRRASPFAMFSRVHPPFRGLSRK